MPPPICKLPGHTVALGPSSVAETRVGQLGFPKILDLSQLTVHGTDMVSDSRSQRPGQAFNFLSSPFKIFLLHVHTVTEWTAGQGEVTGQLKIEEAFTMASCCG